VTHMRAHGSRSRNLLTSTVRVTAGFAIVDTGDAASGALRCSSLRTGTSTHLEMTGCAIEASGGAEEHAFRSGYPPTPTWVSAETAGPAILASAGRETAAQEMTGRTKYSSE